MVLAMSVDCLWQATCLELSLLGRLEVVQALEELLEEQCWQEWLARWLDPGVAIWEPLSNCIEILEILKFSSQKSVDVCSFESCPQLFLTLIKSCCAIFINGSRKP
jgi:hypothetical protein